MNNDIQLEGLARTVYDQLAAFYDVPENQKAFEKWKKEREATKKKDNIKTTKVS